MSELPDLICGPEGSETPFTDLVMSLETIDGIVQQSDWDDPHAEATIRSVLAPGGSYVRRVPIYVDAANALLSTRQSVETYFGQQSQRHLSLCLVEMLDAGVTGQGTVITRKGRLVRNAVAEFTAHGLVPDGFSRVGDETFTIKAKTHRHFAQPCILAKRPWYNNFGHWLVDGASVLALASDIIRAQNVNIIIGKYQSSKVREVVLESIAAIAPGAKILEQPDDELWTFDKLYYVTPPHVPPLFKSPEAIRRLRAVFSDKIPAPPTPRRIYVSRNRAASRRLVNEAEIFSVCQRYGFTMVVPETLPFMEQVQLFAQAEALVGVKGAAFTNVMFCSPKSKIMLLSPDDFPDPFFWDIAGQLGCEYSEAFGPLATAKAQGLNDFTISADQLLLMLAVSGLNPKN